VACGFAGVEVDATASNHKYAAGDYVPLYANKVGPFHNPRLGRRWPWDG
jgi:transmembrane 9 superfamily protein 1